MIVSAILFNAWFLLGHTKTGPWKKFRFAHLMRYLESEEFFVSNNHKIIIVMKSFLSQLTRMKNLIYCIAFGFHFWFCILGIFFKHSLCITVIRLYIFERFNTQTLKLARMSSGSNPVADLNIFLSLDIFLWLYICFLLNIYI